MHDKRLHRTALAAVAALALIVAPTAQARSQHHYKSSILSETLSSGNGYPGVGGQAVIVGIWKTPQYGEGATISHVTITGHPDPNTFEFKGIERLYVAKGTFKDTFTGKSVVQPDGSQKLTITGKFVSGTGAYRGAKGSYKFSGATDPGGNVVTGHSAGAVSY